MEFNLRKLNSTDYDDILVGWWKDWEWTAPPKDFLPEDGEGGVIIFDEEVPVCAGFMYATNSNVAWVDWIISNKQYTKKPHRADAIKLLIETITDLAKDAGYKYAYALIKNNNLINTYENIGYIKGDIYNSEMIKLL